jgi:HAE1 family hydrophobic/amphiphilic exporter-1
MTNDLGDLPQDEFSATQLEVPDSPIIKFFVDRFVLTISLFLAVSLFGLVVALRLGVDLLPRFDIPAIAVSTSFPGATPDDVERDVTQVIEGAVSTVAGVNTVSSTSGAGFSQVVIAFNQDVSSDTAANDVNQRIATIRNLLPTDAEAPVVQKFDPAAQPIMFVAVSGEGVDLRDVFTWADGNLRPQLERVSGVADIRFSGQPTRQVQVLLEPARLESYGLTPQRVAQAIQSSALDLPAGDLNVRGQQVTFATRNTPTTIEQVRNILIDPARGVKLVDVGAVRDATAEATSYARLDGRPIILLSVRKAPGSNSVSVADGVRQVVQRLEKAAPKGYKVEITGDTTTFISQSVRDTFSEGLVTALVVSIVVLVFLGKLNSVFGVLLAIPISLSASLVFFGLFGFTFNIISLLAIIVGIGIVVDDSIVIAENVDRYRKMGLGLRESTIKGGSEVLSAVTASSFSLLAVFIPISLLPGIIGQFFREFGIGLAAAVFFSWLESLFFLTVRLAYSPDPAPPTWRDLPRFLGNIPTVLRWSLRSFRKPLGIVGFVVFAGLVAFMALSSFKQPALLALILAYPLVLTAAKYVLDLLFGLLGALTSSLHAGSERGLDRMRLGYARTLDRFLYRPGLVILAGVAFFVSSFAILPRIPFSFVSDSDNGVMQVNLNLPAGTSLDQTDKLARQMETFLLRQPEVKTVQSTVGLAGGGIAATRPERARANVTLIEKNERESSQKLAVKYQSEIRALLRAFPEAEIRAVATSGGPPGGSGDINFTLNASSRELLVERNRLIAQELRRNESVRNVTTSLEDTTLERAFLPDPSKLSGTGLTPRDLAQSLRTYNVGSKAGDLREGDDTYPIQVKVNPVYLRDDQSFLSLPVFSPSLNTNLPLGQLGRFQLQEAPAAIERSDKAYSSSFTVNLVPGAGGARQVQTQITNELRQKGLIDDRVTISSGGAGTAGGLTNDLLIFGPIAFLFALLLNYLVIGSQFNDFRYPFYILLTVPLALAGGFWLTFLLGAGLDVITVLGTVLLIGLVTKNAILLLDFAVERAKVIPLRRALVEAAALRLRPILMTTVTVVVISFPLVFGSGDGAEFRRGLGIITLGGLVSSTLLTLFVIPAAFYLFEHKRYARNLERRQASLPMLGANPAD